MGHVREDVEMSVVGDPGEREGGEGGDGIKVRVLGVGDEAGVRDELGKIGVRQKWDQVIKEVLRRFEEVFVCLEEKRLDVLGKLERRKEQ